jgi:malyl-CoA/(S)-citramalyl-CoA lyase
VGNSRDWLRPLVLGAPAPFAEVPFGPSRSIHFFDPSNERMLMKVPDLAERADVILANLEDSIPADKKADARSGTVSVAKQRLNGQTPLWVRVNALNSPWVLDDFLHLVPQIGDAIDVIMLPKVESASDILFADRLLALLEVQHSIGRPILIHAILETAKGMTNVEEIAGASPRMQGMSFGPADLAADRRMKVWSVGGPHPDYRVADPYAGDESPAGAIQDLWHYSIARMVDACVSHGIYPYYGPFGDIRDDSGCEVQFRSAYILGCLGAWSLHPDQIAVANSVFRPSESDVQYATEVLESIPDGHGVSTVRGKLQDDATWKQAQVVITLARQFAMDPAGQSGSPESVLPGAGGDRG